MSDSTDLEGTTIGICLAPEGSEETEFTEPRDAVADAGATVEVLGSETDETEIVNNDLESGGGYEIERVSRREKECDALIVPGGTVGADALPMDDDALELLKNTSRRIKKPRRGLSRSLGACRS